MEFYWINKCKENGFRCPRCQLIVGDKDGQLSVVDKNHKIQGFDGQVKCVACNTTIGYFPRKTRVRDKVIEYGMSQKILDSVEYVTAITQDGY